MRASKSEALETVRAAVDASATRMIQVDADRRIHLALYRGPGTWVLHAVNARGFEGLTFSVQPDAFHVAVNVGLDASVTSVTLTSARLARDREITFTRNAEWVEFDAPVEIHSVFVIR